MALEYAKAAGVESLYDDVLLSALAFAARIAAVVGLMSKMRSLW